MYDQKIYDLNDLGYLKFYRYGDLLDCLPALVGSHSPISTGLFEMGFASIGLSLPDLTRIHWHAFEGSSDAERLSIPRHQKENQTPG